VLIVLKVQLNPINQAAHNSLQAYKLCLRPCTAAT